MNVREVAGSISFKLWISQYLIKIIQLLEMTAKYDIERADAKWVSFLKAKAKLDDLCFLSDFLLSL